MPVAVAVSGPFVSSTAGSEVTEPGEEGKVVTVQAPTSAPGRLLVVASGDFMRDMFTMNGENLPFVLNVMDWLAKDESLIALRSRGITERPLQEVSEPTRQAIKAFNMLGGVVLLIAVGLFKWQYRKTRRRHLESAP